MVDRTEVQDFFSRVGGVAKSARLANRAIARGAAPRFCPISLFCPNETDLSRIIAFLLDPMGSHGQWTTFLRLFLDLAGLPESNDDGDSVRVWREDVLSTGEGRADIRVDYSCRAGHRMHILIENKPSAKDGEKQLERYATYMVKRYVLNWAIVYIPSTRRDPGENAIEPERLRALVERKHFICLPYITGQDEASVRRWLQSCGEQCEASHPKRFIHDLMNYVTQNLPSTGVIQMSESERSASQIIVSFLQERDKDIDIAMEIEKALKGLRTVLAEEIAHRLEDGVRTELQGDWKINACFSADQYSGLTVCRSSWPLGRNANGEDCVCWVGFEFCSPNWKDAKFGVAAHRDIVTENVRRRITESVRKEFPDLWSQDAWWPARHRGLPDDIPSDWLSDGFLNFARRVKRGEPATCDILNKFVATLVRVVVIVDEVLAHAHDEPA